MNHDPRHDAQPVIACRDLRKTYHDGGRRLEILQGIDLEVRAGEILAITGPSGVGKSTLLHLLGALDRPTSGEIFHRGRALSAMGRAEVNRLRNEELGFVFQFYHLLPEFNALENVMMPALCRGARRSACRERAEQLLARVGLTERMTHKPGQMSGGEQQRVAIARALFNRPAVLLCDEPTGNLDEGTGASIVDLLWDLNADRETTVVLVTHDEGLAARADRRVQMHAGRVAD
jgi:lipoprotein-releasing system ATP-binding protein